MGWMKTVKPVEEIIVPHVTYTPQVGDIRGNYMFLGEILNHDGTNRYCAIWAKLGTIVFVVTNCAPVPSIPNITLIEFKGTPMIGSSDMDYCGFIPTAIAKLIP